MRELHSLRFQAFVFGAMMRLTQPYDQHRFAVVRMMRLSWLRATFQAWATRQLSPLDHDMRVRTSDVFTSLLLGKRMRLAPLSHVRVMAGTAIFPGAIMGSVAT